MTVVVLVFVSLIAGIAALAVVAAVVSARRERARLTHLHAYAAAQGWTLFAPPAPGPVDAAGRSRRTRLAVRSELDGREVWLIWHQWTESSGENQTTTRNLTRYFLWLGPVYPDVQVVPRTAVGAFFRPVRGIGTGDAEFDRRFLVKPSGHPAPLAVVNPGVRHAMLAGAVAAWEIDRGTLALSYPDRPTAENLQPRARTAVALAGLLS